MKALCLSTLVLFIFGCSEQAGEEQIKSPWDNQLEALQKAKDTQQVVLDGAQRRQEDLERQLQ